MTHFRDFQFNTTFREPKLTVVGAGIGDPDLLTIKGLKALQKADVVLYDALVSEALLEHVPPAALRIYVGKRRHHKAFSQEAINQQIVDYALQYGHVVRLKGGDPFVFGRGMEEMQYAQQQGVAVEYVPGVSSAIAAAGAAGIAVTLRGASRGFWVLTATTDTGDLNPEIASAAQTDATVVILMGLSKLSEITHAYQLLGKEDVAVAVIQNASLPNQQEIIGTIADIGERVNNAVLGSPAVIVIGAVVGQRLAGISELQHQLIESQGF